METWNIKVSRGLHATVRIYAGLELEFLSSRPKHFSLSRSRNRA